MLKQHYQYEKVEVCRAEQPLIVEKICKTEEEYKCVLDFLLSVLRDEYDICVEDIDCNDLTIVLKIYDNMSWKNDGEGHPTTYISSKKHILQD